MQAMWATYAVLALLATGAAVIDVAANGAVRIPMLMQTIAFYIVTYACWRAYGRLAKEENAMLELGLQAAAAIRWANAMAERAVNIPCDDCGNPMGIHDRIDVIERPDGKMYVGHSSHQRAHDWGYR